MNALPPAILRRSVVACLSSLALHACGTTTTAPIDSAVDRAEVLADSAIDADEGVASLDAARDAGEDSGEVGGFTPGPHQPLPLFPDRGGPRIAHPALVTITFAGDPRRAALEAYARWIVGSRWLLTVGGEYGVGAGSIAGEVQLPVAAPASASGADIEAMLAAGITSGAIPTPASGLHDAIYLVYYPAGTRITERCGRFPAIQSCTAFSAIHTDGQGQGLHFAYAVMPDCGATRAGLTALESVEFAASHEIIEAANDPFSYSQPAFELRDDPTDPWFAWVGCEVETADLCELSPSLVREDGHVAARNWSNAAAAAGRDPCVPSDPSTPYFGITATPTTVQRLSPGATVEYTLAGWSTADLPPWQLSTIVTSLNDGSPLLAAAASLSASTVGNGATVSLRVTAPAGALAGSGATIFVRSARSATDYHLWPLVVVSP